MIGAFPRRGAWVTLQLAAVSDDGQATLLELTGDCPADPAAQHHAARPPARAPRTRSRTPPPDLARLGTGRRRRAPAGRQGCRGRAARARRGCLGPVSTTGA